MLLILSVFLLLLYYANHIYSTSCGYGVSMILLFRYVAQNKITYMGSTILILTILAPFVGALSLFFIQDVRRALDVALGFSLLSFLLSVILWVLFTNNIGPSQYQFLTEITWASSWNVHFSIGIDGIGLLFVVLTTFLTPACLLASWESIQTLKKEFFMLFLLLEGFLLCVFTVLDLLLFYIFFESVLIPNKHRN